MATDETLLEYLKPVLRGTRRDLCLKAMRFLAQQGDSPLTASELKSRLIEARVPGAKTLNVADVLGKAGELVVADREGKLNIWRLTGSGEKHVDSSLSDSSELDPVVENAVSGLSNVISAISDDVVRSYVEESLQCFRVDARRASVVFLWSGAIRHLQEAALAMAGGQLNAALIKHDPKARHVAKVEDLSTVKDVVQLLAFREIGLFDKGQWQTLQEGLDLRNRCGHPTKYRPGAAKVGAFIEDILGIVF